MRRTVSLAGFVLCGVLAFSMSARAQDFEMRCVECGDSDSGTATGDGAGSVGTSNGTALFPGGVPTLQSLGAMGTQLRFTVTIAPLPVDPFFCDPAPVGSQFGECDYSTMHVPGVRFFIAVQPGSAYCAQVPTPCDTVASVREGEHYARDTDLTVVFSADLLKHKGIVLPVGGSITLNLKNGDAKKLDRTVQEVLQSDPTAQFFLGFAVGATALDPDPNDGVATKIAPGSKILTISTTKVP